MIAGLVLKLVGRWCAKNWRVLAAGAVVLGVLWLGRYIHGSIYQSGYDARVNEEIAARQKHDIDARVEIVKVGKEYENERQKIIQKGDSGVGVGDRVSDALDVLQSRADRR